MNVSHLYFNIKRNSKTSKDVGCNTSSFNKVENAIPYGK